MGKPKDAYTVRGRISFTNRGLLHFLDNLMDAEEPMMLSDMCECISYADNNAPNKTEEKLADLTAFLLHHCDRFSVTENTKRVHKIIGGMGKVVRTTDRYYNIETTQKELVYVKLTDCESSSEVDEAPLCIGDEVFYKAVLGPTNAFCKWKGIDVHGSGNCAGKLKHIYTVKDGVLLNDPGLLRFIEHLLDANKQMFVSDISVCISYVADKGRQERDEQLSAFLLHHSEKFLVNTNSNIVNIIQDGTGRMMTITDRFYIIRTTKKELVYANFRDYIPSNELEGTSLCIGDKVVFRAVLGQPSATCKWKAIDFYRIENSGRKSVDNKTRSAGLLDCFENQIFDTIKASSNLGPVQDICAAFRVIVDTLEKRGPIPVANITGYIGNADEAVRRVVGGAKSELLHFILRYPQVFTVRPPNDVVFLVDGVTLQGINKVQRIIREVRGKSGSPQHHRIIPTVRETAKVRIIQALQQRGPLPVKNLIGYIASASDAIKAYVGTRQIDTLNFIREFPKTFRVESPNDTVELLEENVYTSDVTIHSDDNEVPGMGRVQGRAVRFLAQTLTDRGPLPIDSLREWITLSEVAVRDLIGTTEKQIVTFVNRFPRTFLFEDDLLHVIDLQESSSSSEKGDDLKNSSNWAEFEASSVAYEKEALRLLTRTLQSKGSLTPARLAGYLAHTDVHVREHAGKNDEGVERFCRKHSQIFHFSIEGEISLKPVTSKSVANFDLDQSLCDILTGDGLLEGKVGVEHSSARKDVATDAGPTDQPRVPVHPQGYQSHDTIGFFEINPPGRSAQPLKPSNLISKSYAAALSGNNEGSDCRVSTDDGLRGLHVHCEEMRTDNGLHVHCEETKRDNELHVRNEDIDTDNGLHVHFEETRTDNGCHVHCEETRTDNGHDDSMATSKTRTSDEKGGTAEPGVSTDGKPLTGPEGTIREHVTGGDMDKSWESSAFRGEQEMRCEFGDFDQLDALKKGAIPECPLSLNVAAFHHDLNFAASPKSVETCSVATNGSFSRIVEVCNCQGFVILLKNNYMVLVGANGKVFTLLDEMFSLEGNLKVNLGRGMLLQARFNKRDGEVAEIPGCINKLDVMPVEFPTPEKPLSDSLIMTGNFAAVRSVCPGNFLIVVQLWSGCQAYLDYSRIASTIFDGCHKPHHHILQGDVVSFSVQSSVSPDEINKNLIIAISKMEVLCKAALENPGFVFVTRQNATQCEGAGNGTLVCDESNIINGRGLICTIMYPLLCVKMSSGEVAAFRGDSPLANVGGLALGDVVVFDAIKIRDGVATWRVLRLRSDNGLSWIEGSEMSRRPNMLDAMD